MSTASTPSNPSTTTSTPSNPNPSTTTSARRKLPNSYFQLDMFRQISFFPHTITKQQITDCLKVIRYMATKFTNDTQLFNAVSSYNPNPHPSHFFDCSDFHGKLMVVYLKWLKLIQKRYSLEKANKKRDTNSIPESISPQDFMLCCSIVRECYFSSGTYKYKSERESKCFAYVYGKHLDFQFLFLLSPPSFKLI